MKFWDLVNEPKRGRKSNYESDEERHVAKTGKILQSKKHKKNRKIFKITGFSKIICLTNPNWFVLSIVSDFQIRSDIES